MSRIQKAFQALAASKKKAYIGYAMAGFPESSHDFGFAQGVLAEADLLEIGVPFSDPIADGVVLQKASERALHNGGGMKRALELARQLRQGSEKPLLLMSYLNPLLAMGLETFAHAAKGAGVDGVVVPDLPPDGDEGFARALKEAGLDVVFLVAPTSTPARLKAVAKVASGFVYVVSVAGVTGERQAFDARLSKTVAELRKQSKLPLAIGFGIASPEGAQEAARLADGVVVASTILKVAQDSSDPDNGVQAAVERTRLLARAVKEL
jgi:tryptophan synthase alpha chain